MAKNVTIQRIVSVLLHRAKFIILATVVMGLLFFMYSRFVIAPMYSTSTMIYVQNYSSAQRDNANTKATTSTKTESDSKKTSNEENQKIYPADISASLPLQLDDGVVDATPREVLCQLGETYQEVGFNWITDPAVKDSKVWYRGKGDSTWNVTDGESVRHYLTEGWESLGNDNWFGCRNYLRVCGRRHL